MKQQDAEEFLGWVLDVLRRGRRKAEEGGGLSSDAMAVDFPHHHLGSHGARTNRNLPLCNRTASSVCGV